MLSAAASAITSYGPVTPTADDTRSRSTIALATSPALPTSVWMRMYAVTIATTSPTATRPAPTPQHDASRVAVHGPARAIAPTPQTTGRPRRAQGRRQAGSGTAAHTTGRSHK